MEYWQDDRRIARLSDADVVAGEVYDWESGTWLPNEAVGEDVRTGEWISISEEKMLLLTEDPQGWLGPSPADPDAPTAPPAESTSRSLGPEGGRPPGSGS